MSTFARRSAATLVAAGIVLTACGIAEDAAPDTAAAPAETAAENDLPALTPADSEGRDAQPENEIPNESDVPAASDSATTPVDETPAPTDPPPVAVPVPDAVIGGRALSSELSPTSDFSANVLPDIQVDDIRREMKVGLRNVFPAERPVLFWLWAPH